MNAGFRHHGGRLADACARFGGGPSQWLDLSTGINPVAWQVPEDIAVDWRALPEPAALARLERVAAAHFGCPPSLCAAVPGSETGLRLVARLLGLPGLYRPPAYGTYRAAFAQAGAIADFADLPDRATALVLGNPNNPDGHVMPPADLLALLGHQQRHEGWLIVDEAFADCDPGTSIAAEVAAGRRLVVVRSFGKFFGLAGLRLGFVIAPQDVLQALRDALGDWPVHAAALAIGAAAYADATWISHTRRDLVARAAALDGLLERHGLRPGGACPLFRLITAPRAGDWFAPLARRHILTRPFADDADRLRVGLPPDHAALERLDRALAEVRADG